MSDRELRPSEGEQVFILWADGKWTEPPKSLGDTSAVTGATLAVVPLDRAQRAEEERDETQRAAAERKAELLARSTSVAPILGLMRERDEAVKVLSELVEAISMKHGKRSESAAIRYGIKRQRVEAALVAARAILNRGAS